MPRRKHPKLPKLVAISLGAGVQSSVLLLKACKGELEKPDCAIFADTQWEPQSVYDYLEFLIRCAEGADIPVHVVTRENIKNAFLNKASIKASPPLFTALPGKRVSILRRQCTLEYKIVPIRRKLRELQLACFQPVELWLGITKDEIMRAKTSQVKWVTHRFPLLEQNFSRHDCFRWIEENHYPIPPKSACIGCAYRSDASWDLMKKTDPESWMEAVNMDEALRSGVWDKTLKATPFLHRSGKPLSEVELCPTEKDKLDLWNLECEGMCGM